jgi:hypothetical protein
MRIDVALIEGLVARGSDLQKEASLAGAEKIDLGSTRRASRCADKLRSKRRKVATEKEYRNRGDLCAVPASKVPSPSRTALI